MLSPGPAKYLSLELPNPARAPFNWCAQVGGCDATKALIASGEFDKKLGDVGEWLASPPRWPIKRSWQEKERTLVAAAFTLIKVVEGASVSGQQRSRVFRAAPRQTADAPGSAQTGSETRRGEAVKGHPARHPPPLSLLSLAHAEGAVADESNPLMVKLAGVDEDAPNVIGALFQFPKWVADAVSGCA